MTPFRAQRRRKPPVLPLGMERVPDGEKVPRTIELSQRQVLAFESFPPRLVQIKAKNGRWVFVLEDRRMRGERRTQAIGKKVGGEIHFSASEFQALKAPHPTGFASKNLYEVSIDERRKRTRRTSPRASNGKARSAK